MSRWCPQVLCAALLLTSNGAALRAVADPLQLEVEIAGLDGALRDNVRAHLSLLAMPDEDRTAAKILALHRRADFRLSNPLAPRTPR